MTEPSLSHLKPSSSSFLGDRERREKNKPPIDSIKQFMVRWHQKPLLSSIILRVSLGISEIPGIHGASVFTYRFGGRWQTVHSGSLLAQSERTGIQGVEVEKEVGRAWEHQCLHCLSTGEHGCKQKQAWCVRNRRVLVSKPLTWFRPEKKTHDANKAGSEKGSARLSVPWTVSCRMRSLQIYIFGVTIAEV